LDFRAFPRQGSRKAELNGGKYLRGDAKEAQRQKSRLTITEFINPFIRERLECGIKDCSMILFNIFPDDTVTSILKSRRANVSIEEFKNFYRYSRRRRSKKGDFAAILCEIANNSGCPEFFLKSNDRGIN